MNKVITGATAIAAAAVGLSQRRQLANTEAGKRCTAALHVLRGRPLVWRVNLVMPEPAPLLNFAEGSRHVRVAEVVLNPTPRGATAVRFPAPSPLLSA